MFFHLRQEGHVYMDEVCIVYSLSLTTCPHTLTQADRYWNTVGSQISDFNLAFSSSSSVDEGDVAHRLLLHQLRRGWIHLLLLHLPQWGESCVFIVILPHKSRTTTQHCVLNRFYWAQLVYLCKIEYYILCKIIFPWNQQKKMQMNAQLISLKVSQVGL